MSTDLVLVRELPAAAEDVFRAFVEPELYAAWIWGSLSLDVVATLDVRVGGRFEVTTERAEGATWSFSGEYVEVEPHRRLVFTLAWDAPMGYESDEEVLTVELEALDEGTRLTFTHSGVPIPEARKAHRQGWEDSLNRLTLHLAGVES
ncbi:MAG: SRPBCC domain-containing protein [Acidobacteriota bacterium]